MASPFSADRTSSRLRTLLLRIHRDIGQGKVRALEQQRLGSDSVPDRIDAIRSLLADNRDLAEVVGDREMRQNSRSGSLRLPRVSVRADSIEIRNERRGVLSGPRSGIDGHAHGSETLRQTLAGENQVESGSTLRILLVVTASATRLLLGVGMCVSVQINKS